MQHLVSSKSVCQTRQVKQTYINMWKLSIETAVENEIFFNIHISVLLVFFFMFVDMQRIKCNIYLLCKRHASNESEIGKFFNGKFDFFFLFNHEYFTFHDLCQNVKNSFPFSPFCFINKFKIFTAFENATRKSHIKIKWNIQNVQSFIESMFTFSVRINKKNCFVYKMAKINGMVWPNFQSICWIFFVYFYLNRIFDWSVSIWWIQPESSLSVCFVFRAYTA